MCTPPSSPIRPGNRLFNAPIKVWFRLAQPGQRKYSDRPRNGTRYPKGIIYPDRNLTEVRADLGVAKQTIKARDMTISILRQKNVTNSNGESAANYAGKRIAGDSVTITDQQKQLDEKLERRERVWKAAHEKQ